MSAVACPDTPPLLIQRGVLRGYHAAEPKCRRQSTDGSDLDPNDFDENVAHSQQQSLSSAAQEQGSPLKSQQPLPAPMKAAPETAKSSIWSAKNLASIFFRSPGVAGAKDDTNGGPGAHRGLTTEAESRRRKPFAQSMICPQAASRQPTGPSSQHPSLRHPGAAPVTPQTRFGLSRPSRASQQAALSRIINNNVYPRQ